MTAEEVQAKIAEATQAVKSEEEKARADLEADLNDAKAKLTEQEKSLEGMNDKDENFKATRQLIDSLQNKVKDLEQKSTTTDQVINARLTERTRDDVIRKLSDNDRDLEAKLKIQYDRLIKTEEKVDDDVIARVAAEAYKLSVDTPQPSVINRVMSNKPAGGPATSESTVDPEVLSAAAAFGLTEADIKTYGKK